MEDVLLPQSLKHQSLFVEGKGDQGSIFPGLILITAASPYRLLKLERAKLLEEEGLLTADHARGFVARRPSLHVVTHLRSQSLP
jgi:hypothetical protein